MSGLRLCTSLLCALAALAFAPAAAPAAPLLPEPGKVFSGVASGGSLADFRARTRSRPAVWHHWIRWGGRFEPALERARRSGTRLMLHLSTAAGQNVAGRISPGGIARGDGDGYLAQLNRGLSAYGGPVYLRVMGEMNNCDLAYAPLNCDGSRRPAAFSARRFRRAWKRIAIVVRGGDGPSVERRLARAHLPALRTDGPLGRPRVALIWSPMTGGSPMVPALDPGRFWPGSKWVDWVGTSFYSRFPTWHFLNPYYARFAVRYRKPFAFTEWAMWGSDDPGFARALFAWTRTHARTRMMVYNQGADQDSLFRLRRFPRATAVIRRELAAPRFRTG